MPTYQYACTACAEQLEAVQSFSEAALTTCPACGGTLRKVFSAVGVVFKGSGFYKTDSRASSKGDSKPKGDKPAETAAKSASSGTSDSSGSNGSSGKSDSAPATSTPAASSTPAA